jgi:hypothetical protein
MNLRCSAALFLSRVLVQIGMHSLAKAAAPLFVQDNVHDGLPIRAM